ncbi:peptide chain release factor 1, putative, partial [Ichthyophthirius multifiliis]
KFARKTEKLFIEKQYILTDLNRVIYKKMFQQHQQFSNIQNLLSQENTVYNLDNPQKRKHLIYLQVLNDQFEKFQNTIIQLQDLKEILTDPKQDSEMIAFANEEIQNQQTILDEIQEECIRLLIPKGKFDDSTEIHLEIRPGTGGSESSLFAEELFKMYQNFCAISGYQCKTESFQTDMSINKGCKLGILKIEGEEIYKRLLNESGVHKVIRIPETESKGRLHSSTVSVVVMPIAPFDFKVDEKQLKFEYMRSQGAGGQHVNKVESACRVTHIATGVSVLCQDERYQDRNKARALKLLYDKLYFLEVEKYNEEQSFRRKSQMGGGDRSDKIRTYNFPQDRITDHRSNLTVFGIEKMMEGQFLDQFIDQYQEKVQNEMLVQMIKQLEIEKDDS